MANDGWTSCHWEHTGDRADGNCYMDCCGQMPVEFKHHWIKDLLKELAKWHKVQDYLTTRDAAHTLDHLKRNVEPELRELRTLATFNRHQMKGD